MCYSDKIIKDTVHIYFIKYISIKIKLRNLAIKISEM